MALNVHQKDEDAVQRPPHRRFDAAIYSRQAAPPTPELRPGRMDWLFEIHADPIFNHPLWSQVQGVPCLRVEVRCLYDQTGKQTWDPAAGPADTVYAFMALLARFMDGFERAGRDPSTFRWFGLPAGFGGAASDKELTTYPNAIPLLNHPADRLKSGRRGPYFAHGLRRNLAWAEEFFPHLAAELKGRRIPDPIAMLLATEKGVQDDYTGHFGVPDTGWVPEALADPRADDPAHLIDGHHTFAEYMRLSRTRDGDPVPPYRHEVPLGMPPGRSPLNDESSERYRGAIRLAWDWSREQAFNRPARRAFLRDPFHPDRTVYCGEYQAACDSPWAPVRVRPRTLLHQMNGIFYSDVQCPDWYGGLPGERKEDDLNKREDGWETPANWLKVYPSRQTDEIRKFRAAGVEAAKAIATAHARSAPRSPLVPYVTHLYGLPEDDMVEYLWHCKSVGARGVCVFMPKPDQAGHDYWARVIARVER